MKRGGLLFALALVALLRASPIDIFARELRESERNSTASIIFREGDKTTSPGGGNGGGRPSRPGWDTNLVSREDDLVSVPDPGVPSAVPDMLPKTGGHSTARLSAAAGAALIFAGARRPGRKPPG